MYKNNGAKLTQAQMVLIAMYLASNGTASRIPYEEIVMQAWREFPAVFGLRNYPEYPDASDIHKKIYQTLKPSGFAVAIGDKFFRLTDKGIAEARALMVGDSEAGDSVHVVRLSREEETFIRHATHSRAFATWMSDCPDKLVDFDAQLFFKFSANTNPSERARRCRFAVQSIRKAQQAKIEKADSLAALADYFFKHFPELLDERNL